ncbi:MAG: hypothetical protein LZ174_09740 [Thaumarchaeota archaeon]|nr:hypothetical protein [Candidatus Geocrenenecus arthurdayi]
MIALDCIQNGVRGERSLVYFCSVDSFKSPGSPPFSRYAFENIYANSSTRYAF